MLKLIADISIQSVGVELITVILNLGHSFFNIIGDSQIHFRKQRCAEANSARYESEKYRERFLNFIEKSMLGFNEILHCAYVLTSHSLHT